MGKAAAEEEVEDEGKKEEENLDMLSQKRQIAPDPERVSAEYP